MNDRSYYCIDCHCFVEENHRCQQWGTVFIIPKEAINVIKQRQQKKIERLKAENPQEECIECGGYGFIVKGGAEHHPQCNGDDCSIYGCPIDGRYRELCPSCQGLSKISKVKEQDLIIKELQAQLAEANERIDAWREGI